MNTEYHKIQSVFHRDPETKNRRFLMGEWSDPAFEFLQDRLWIWTEKVDGANIRVHWDGEKVHFNGRTDNSQMPSRLVSYLRETFTEERFRELGFDPMCLHGEGFGAGIQKGGGNYMLTQRFVLFDVSVPEKQGGCESMFLERKNALSVASSLAIPIVPIVGRGTISEAIEYVKSKPESQWGSFTAEGIVLRPEVELRTRRGDRVITKLKVKDFA